jgi:N utilization substance protein B
MTKIKADPSKTKQLVSKRSLSRLIAVQTLYQYYYKNQDVDILQVMDDVIDNYTIDPDNQEVESYRKKVDMTFLRNLVSGIILVLKKVDDQVTNALGEGHEFDNIPDVMLQILRFGAFELQFIQDNPVNITINEYVDIASSFYDTKKVGFVNGVLDKISKELKK